MVFQYDCGIISLYNIVFVLVATGVLLETLYDKNVTVSESATSSILKLAEKHPNTVLLSCSKFYMDNTKLSNEQISSILNIMSKICTEHILSIDGDTVMKTIDFSLSVMTKNSNYEPLVQLAASNILVSLGRAHYLQVITV